MRKGAEGKHIEVEHGSGEGRNAQGSKERGMVFGESEREGACVAQAASRASALQPPPLPRYSSCCSAAATQARDARAGRGPAAAAANAAVAAQQSPAPGRPSPPVERALRSTTVVRGAPVVMVSLEPLKHECLSQTNQDAQTVHLDRNHPISIHG